VAAYLVVAQDEKRVLSLLLGTAARDPLSGWRFPDARGIAFRIGFADMTVSWSLTPEPYAEGR
jgi:hypothetical protein